MRSERCVSPQSRQISSGQFQYRSHIHQELLLVTTIKFHDSGTKNIVATENVDYRALPTMVEVSPEQNFQGCFNLSLVNDDMFEDDEDFFIHINTTDTDAFVNTPTARVVIEDEDCKLIALPLG